VITEKELERALELRDEIKEMRVKLSKIKDINVSRTDIGSSFSIDNNKIEVDEYTIGTLRRFARDIYNIYTKRLEDLEKEYSSIVMSEDDAIERALFGDDE
jgi:hypothetical protein